MPFMQMSCWEQDTLFIIFEEDFRFEREEADAPRTTIPVADLKTVEPAATDSESGKPERRSTADAWLALWRTRGHFVFVLQHSWWSRPCRMHAHPARIPLPARRAVLGWRWLLLRCRCLWL